MRRGSRWLPALGLGCVLLASACGSGASDESAIEAATDELIVVCRDGSQARLEELTGPGAQDRLRDPDPAFGGRIDDIEITDREVIVEGADAVVALTLEVTVDGESMLVDRLWVYEKVDDMWLLAEVPDCVFTSPGRAGG